MRAFEGEVITSDQQFFVEAACPTCGAGATIPISITTALSTTRDDQHLSLKFKQEKQSHMCEAK